MSKLKQSLLRRKSAVQDHISINESPQEHQEHQESREFNLLPQCRCADCIQRRSAVSADLKHASDIAGEVRLQLLDTEPEWFFNGMLPPVAEPLPDPFLFIQEGEHLTPVILWDYAFIGNLKMTSKELMRRQSVNCEGR